MTMAFDTGVKELGRDDPLGGLLGDGLGAVRAELGELAAAAVRSAPIDSSPRCSDTITAFTPAASCSALLTTTACSS
jgi:hypothetical protein